jgi:hypothetical protein
MIFYMISFIIIILVADTSIYFRKLYFSVLSHNIDKRDDKLYLHEPDNQNKSFRI